jgi:DNA primase
MESDDASAARSYLYNERGLTAETLKRFQIGWAPSGGRALLGNALKAGITEADLARTGLITRSQRDGSWRDFFWGRILFPILDVKGQTIAFGGRVLDSAVRPGANPPPKYLNSGDTEVFQKGKNLYGFYHGARAIRDRKSVVVLEGYMDVIGCHQAGYEAAVAPLGTAMTSDQCHLLKRYVDQVTLLFDADRAGDSAAQRGSELLLEYGFLPLIARLPEKQDADEYLEEHSVQEFEKLLQSGVSFIEFKLNILWAQNPGAPEEIKKGVVSKELMPLVGKIEDPIVRKEMRKLVADRLGVSEEDLDAVLSRSRKTPTLGAAARAAKTAAEEKPSASKKSVRQRIEEELLCLAIRHPEFRQDLFLADEQSPLFSDPKCLEAFKALKLHPELLQAGELLNLLQEETVPWLSALLIRQVESKPQEVFDGLMQRLAAVQREEKLKELKKPAIERLESGQAKPGELEYMRIAKISKGMPK